MSGQFNPVVLGKLGSAYGIRGWLRVFSSTEHADAIFDYQPWQVRQSGQWQAVELESWKRHNQELIVKLKGIDDRDAANRMVNAEIAVDTAQLPALQEGEYYWKDLLGCRVLTLSGYDLGTVTDMMETGSNDVLVVRANPKDAFAAKERLIPFLEQQVIIKVDLDQRLIEVDWQPDF
ncbi:MAG: ribosome maturation factor RimM [Enterobacteriaceae bacterium]